MQQTIQSWLDGPPNLLANEIGVLVRVHDRSGNFYRSLPVEVEMRQLNGEPLLNGDADAGRIPDDVVMRGRNASFSATLWDQEKVLILVFCNRCVNDGSRTDIVVSPSWVFLEKSAEIKVERYAQSSSYPWFNLVYTIFVHRTISSRQLRITICPFDHFTL